MSLSALFDIIATPTSDMFNAEPVGIYSEHRLGKTKEGYPAILVRTQRSLNQKQRFTLQNLRILQDVACQITRNGVVTSEFFTVIIFTNNTVDLQSYFLKISEVLLDSLPIIPTEKQVSDAIFRYIEIFKLLNDEPRKSALGLWAELFVIATSDNPKKLLTGWHTNPSDTFDFELDANRIEVKATLQDQRVHSFSLEQLNPPDGISVQVASLMTRLSASGTTIPELIEAIQTQLNDIKLAEKLLVQVAQTLGKAYEEAVQVKFDAKSASQSLRYYESSQIPKVESVHVPVGVSNVRFQVTLG